MADPKKSYNDILTWAKGTSNDIVAKQLATARTISITNNSGTSLASGTFNGTGNLTLKLPATVGIDISGNAATATTATTATKLGSNAGTGKIPIYFSGGKPVACGTELSVTADQAKKLASAKSITLTGAVTGSGNFDGSSNVSIATTATQVYCTAASGEVGSTTLSNDRDTSYPYKNVMPAYETGGHRFYASKNKASSSSPIVVVEFRRFFYDVYKTSGSSQRFNIEGWAFYRKWSDGWITQGGFLSCTPLYTDNLIQSPNIELYFPVPFQNAPYICFCSLTGGWHSISASGGAGSPALDYPVNFAAYNINRLSFETTFETRYKVTSKKQWFAEGY